MAQKTIVNSEVIKYIKEYAGNLRRNDVPAEKVLLFGSQATGKAHEKSDIDICVVVSPGYQANPRFPPLRHFLPDYKNNVDVVAYTAEDLKDKYDPLAREIRNYGICMDF